MICLHVIDLAWQEVTRRTFNLAWDKLWPAAVAKRDFEGFEPETNTKNKTKVIMSLGKTMSLEVDEDDVNELIEEHGEEL